MNARSDSGTVPVGFEWTPYDQPVVDTDYLATPTGVVLSTAKPRTDEWFEARRAGITATDLPAILGLSPYGNALSVWADKRGEIAPEDLAGEAALWGTVLEDPIAREWGRRHDSGVLPIGVLAHVEATWQRASLDRLVRRCPDGDGPCQLEVKTRSAYVAGRWRDDIPDDVLAQVQWQLHVSGYRHAHVAALIGGQSLREHRVDRDPVVIELLVREAARVWEAVQTGTPPASPHNELLRRVLDSIHPVRDGVAHAPRATVTALLAERKDASVEVAEARREVEAARTRMAVVDAALVELLGDKEALVIEGGDTPSVTYRQTTRRGYTVAPATYRTLRVDYSAGEQ